MLDINLQGRFFIKLSGLSNRMHYKLHRETPLFFSALQSTESERCLVPGIELLCFSHFIVAVPVFNVRHGFSQPLLPLVMNRIHSKSMHIVTTVFFFLMLNLIRFCQMTEEK